MIVARSPLRITLGGGGTDLPSYSDQHEGFCIAAAIDASVVVTVGGRLGMATTFDKNPIVTAALDMLDIDPSTVSIGSHADVPAGTGLGSSGSFATALLAALSHHRRIEFEPYWLAGQACAIEIERLGLPVGRQDQHIAALGGIQCMYFRRDGTVEALPLAILPEARARLEAELLLFHTGIGRSAPTVLADQDRRTRALDPAMLDNLHAIKAMALESKAALLAGDTERFGRLMDQHWRIKRARSDGMSDPEIDGWYQLALDNGASGGKLVGAGAGGFLMFHALDATRLRRAMRDAGLVELLFRLDDRGTRVLA